MLLASLVSVAEAQTPIITAQPTNETVLAGSAATFSVAVSGTGPFTYQWQFNGTNLPPGIITTVAGGGINGYWGDGGAAISAELAGPTGVAVDATGNLFIADAGNNRIREVGTNGIITTVAGGGTNGLGDGGPATNAELANPGGVAVDASGNLFIADVYNNRIREVGTNGIIITVAGNGTAGYSGDGGAATNAELYNPVAVAVDASANLFIADLGNNVILEVGTNGIITTVAGDGGFRAGAGVGGYSGDGGPATNAELSDPSGVAVDASGNLFIADYHNQRIRKVGTNGIITTVAGNGIGGYSGDGGPATNAELTTPSGVAVDASGNLFIADWNNNVIREVGTNGIITTVAGNGYVNPNTGFGGYSGDGGTATNAELANPGGVAVGASGNLFIADTYNNAIRKVGTDGIITTVAGNGTGGYSGDGGAATNAALDLPTGVAVDSSGNLFIADSSNARIREVGADGIITTVAGNGIGGYFGDGGAATNAELETPIYDGFGFKDYPPMGVAVDATGNLFIADNGNNRVRQVVFPGPTVALNDVTGANAGEYHVVVSSPYGSVTSSVVSLVVLLPPTINTQPESQGIALGSNATLSVAAGGTAPLGYQWYFDGAPLDDQTNTTLPLIAAAYTNAGSYTVVIQSLYGSITSAVAVVSVGLAPGITKQPVSQTNLFSSAATFSVGVSGTGPFAFQWQFNGVNLPNGVITTVAGNGIGGYSGDGGAATNAEFRLPNSVAVDPSGNLFIADEWNQRIRKVGTNGIITTVAGNGKGGYSGDGAPATNAELSYPFGVAVDASSNLFIADSDNNRIRRVGSDGIITTAAGNGLSGYSGDGGTATNAELGNPGGVAVDASGNLFIADSGNSVIRKVGTNRIIYTVAGNGAGGYSGDGGVATHAALSNPTGVAVDAFGNLFIADSGNSVIRKVGTNGIISTVAGNGTFSYSGDGAPATSAELNYPSGVAVDAFDNLFIADTDNNVIRKVGINGIITTVAGNYQLGWGYSGDGGTATNAELSTVAGVAVDAFGNLFIADEWNQRIREVVFPGPALALSNVSGANAGDYDVVVSSPYGSVTSSVVSLVVPLPPTINTQPLSQAVLLGSNAKLSVAASGTAPLEYQWYFDGAPLNDQTNTLALIAVASTNAGSYSVVIQNPYASITSAVAVVSVGLAPGITKQPVSQTNLFSSAASFTVAISGTGPFTFQWQFNGLNLPNGIIATVAGDVYVNTNRGYGGYSGDGGLAINAALWGPEGVAVDPSGNLFIADRGNDRIRQVGTDGIITTVAGNGTFGYSGDGGIATNAELRYPSGVAVDTSGNLFIADQFNNRIRKVGTNGIISTVAGNGINGYSGDGGPATSAELNYPAGVAMGAIGNLFIADSTNNRVRKVGTDGIITTVAGNGIGGYSGDGGTATNAELNYPQGVAVDTSGNLFIADQLNYRIRKVGTNGIITTVAGNGIGGYSGDGGAATDAGLYWPTGVALDASGNLLIADYGNNRIREVGTNGIITTVAGNGNSGYSGDGGAATDAELNYPGGVAVDASGNLFIGDTSNNRVRKVVFSTDQSPMLVLSNVSGANAGGYDVVVSSPYGSVTSSVVSLDVTIPPLNALNIGGQQLQLQFQGVPGNSYVLLSATDLTPPVDWRPVITNTAETNGNWTFSVSIVLSDHAIFYTYRGSNPGQ
jgi:hypothetical protein